MPGRPTPLTAASMTAVLAASTAAASRAGIGRVGSGGRDGLDGIRARDLARGVAAHAVADGEQRRGHEIGVLVMVADASHVRARAPHERGGRAGVVGGIRLDAVVRDGGEALRAAGVGELRFDLDDVDFRGVLGRGGVGDGPGRGRARVGPGLDGLVLGKRRVHAGQHRDGVFRAGSLRGGLRSFRAGAVRCTGAAVIALSLKNASSSLATGAASVSLGMGASAKCARAEDGASARLVPVARRHVVRGGLGAGRHGCGGRDGGGSGGGSGGRREDLLVFGLDPPRACGCRRPARRRRGRPARPSRKYGRTRRLSA